TCSQINLCLSPIWPSVSNSALSNSARFVLVPNSLPIRLAEKQGKGVGAWTTEGNWDDRDDKGDWGVNQKGSFDKDRGAPRPFFYPQLLL
ncbi:hypothetical protein N9D23_08245, partial [Rubripirellula sp.]|nr:hypothetical protein [Rubripirellula sp.]